jgi:hypothetical protein
MLFCCFLVNLCELSPSPGPKANAMRKVAPARPERSSGFTEYAHLPRRIDAIARAALRATRPRPDSILITEDPEMLDSPRRRLTMADAMLLVAALAPGLILLRIAARLGLFARPPSNSPPGREFLEHLAVAGGSLLFPLALAVIVLTLREPHRARRDAIRRPGFVSCVALAVAAILPIAHFLVRVATVKKANLPAAVNQRNFTAELSLSFNNMFGRLESEAGPMIAGAWLALALTGRWRPGPSWLDRLGCLVGACFIVMYIYIQCYFVLRPLFFP